MKEYKISIIIPVYNSEKTISKCIDSILNQTINIDEIQLIIINDGSTDHSEKIITKYKKQYKNLVYIKKPNGGQAEARNVGLLHALGKYISFVDSDDWIDETMLEKMLNEAENMNSDIVVCDICKVFKNKKIYMKGIFGSEINNRKYFISPAGPCNKIYKKELFINNDITFLENHIYEDLATMPLIGLYAKNISYVPDPLYYYYQGQNSTMRQKKYNKNLEDIFPVLNFLKKEVIERGFGDYFPELEFVYINNLLLYASERFSNYKESKDQLTQIKNIMNSEYPNWNQNKYYLKQSFKYKLEVNLYYYNLAIFIKIIKFIKRKVLKRDDL